MVHFCPCPAPMSESPSQSCRELWEAQKTAFRMWLMQRLRVTFWILLKFTVFYADLYLGQHQKIEARPLDRTNLSQFLISSSREREERENVPVWTGWCEWFNYRECQLYCLMCPSQLIQAEDVIISPSLGLSRLYHQRKKRGWKRVKRRMPLAAARGSMSHKRITLWFLEITSKHCVLQIVSDTYESLTKEEISTLISS